jgi:hypothetical protein
MTFSEPKLAFFLTLEIISQGSFKVKFPNRRIRNLSDAYRETNESPYGQIDWPHLGKDFHEYEHTVKR